MRWKPGWFLRDAVPGRTASVTSLDTALARISHKNASGNEGGHGGS